MNVAGLDWTVVTLFKLGPCRPAWALCARIYASGGLASTTYSDSRIRVQGVECTCSSSYVLDVPIVKIPDGCQNRLHAACSVAIVSQPDGSSRPVPCGSSSFGGGSALPQSAYSRRNVQKQIETAGSDSRIPVNLASIHAEQQNARNRA